MNASSNERPKTPVRSRSLHSRNAPGQTTDLACDTLNFGTASELTGPTTPPTAKVIPPQTPSFSLSGRTKETLRLARERQLESVRKPARATKSTTSTSNNVSALRGNAQIPSSVSRPRVQVNSTFNPSRSRPTTPISSIRASTPTTPVSRRSKQANISVTSSPNTTPNSVRTTSAGSSMVVRDAIRKAKEAHKQKQKTPPTVRSNRINYADDTSFDDIYNPFNTSPGTPPMQAQLKRAIETGRTTGRTFRCFY
jgi:hypothetical protein